MNEQKSHDNQYIAVFDVGKTNKKLLIFDSSFQIVASTYATFDAFQEDALFYESLRESAAWFLESLKEMAAQFPIGAVSVSAHGGTFVCLDNAGELAMPVLSYTSDPGEFFHQRFHQNFGDADELHLTLKTPSMPGLGCMAKGIYFAQEKYPQEFERTDIILNLPQYYGYLLTGKYGVEKTYLGSHTYLWDFDGQCFSAVVDQLGIRNKIPQNITNPWDVLGTVSPAIANQTGLSEKTLVTVGIHDSNAALLPYLIKVREPFTLNSTGSVCVAMRPGGKISITREELGKVVYYNLSAFSDPVKTSIFLGGMEFDTYAGFLLNLHNNRPFPAFDRKVCEKVLLEKRHFIIPSIIPFGMFPQSSPRVIEGDKEFSFADIAAGNFPPFFHNFEYAYAVLSISQAIQSKVSLTIVGNEKGDIIFVEGGFRKNDYYMAMLSALLPGSKLFLTNLEEASAFGAALLGKSAIEGKHPREMDGSFEIEIEMIQHDLDGVQEYERSFGEYIL